VEEITVLGQRGIQRTSRMRGSSWEILVSCVIDPEVFGRERIYHAPHSIESVYRPRE
jgi:hypothetical protein